MIASYESFTLVESRGEDTAELRKAGADLRDDMRRVRAADGRFDPKATREPLLDKRAAAPGRSGLALVAWP